ncbi:MAG TPA: response regulator [Actinomycetota bacterium]|jgi:diguanylate cyclase (GGDEF)-like protein|nr:response regulator [Actinomycetota bacterium]
MRASTSAKRPGVGAAPEAPHTGRPIILVADDDEDILKFIEVNLRSQGHAVVTARDGETALALALEYRPALVLLDIVIPGVDGYEVCRRLRSDWRFGDPSVILLTGRSLPADRNIGLAAGADDFIVKPFDPVELVSRVNLVLRRLEQVRSASPLTGLPGNLQIQRELQMRVAAGEEVALLYIDLDQFKAYNDHYGFLRGDEAIEALAEVLWSAAEDRPDTFLGHVGGDDFIVLTHPDIAEMFVQDVITGFETRVEHLYEREDAARGYIEIVDRQGRRRRIPLLTLSIGVATNLGREVHDHRALVDIATEMKEFAKRKEGNAVAVDRRAGGDLAARLVGLAPVGRSRRVGARRHRLVRGYIAGAGVALLVLALVMGPTAIVLAENSAPGDSLYSLKLGVEEARLLANGDPAREVQLHLEFATKRLWELRPLFAEERLAFVGTVTENLRLHTASSVAGLDEVRGTIQGEALRSQVESVLSRQVESLADLFEGSCGAVTDAVPAGRVSGGPAEACEDLGRAFRDSARALAGVRPIQPVAHQTGGQTDGRGGNPTDRGRRGNSGPAKRQNGKKSTGHRRDRKVPSEKGSPERDADRGGTTGGSGSGRSGGNGSGQASSGQDGATPGLGGGKD